MANLNSLVLLVGRILLAAMFVEAGFRKLTGGYAATAVNIAAHHLPLPKVLAAATIVFELGGGLMLVVGLFARCVGLALFFYTLVLAVVFHPFWSVPAAQHQAQMAIFMSHLSIMGGMLYVFAFGAGPASVDGRRR
jgi:putative oxidoreductase